MAETSVELSNEQKKLAQDWINKKWTASKTCPICATNGWVISDHVVQPVTHSPVGRMQLTTGPAYPAVLLICKTCGYTRAFNAVMMGLFPNAKGAANAGD